MSNPLPLPIVAVVSKILAERRSHTVLTRLFEEAGVPGDSPKGNKEDRCREYLKRAGTDDVDAHVVLGKVIHELMEVDAFSDIVPEAQQSLTEDRNRIHKVLADHGRTYLKGGVIGGGATGAPAQSLEQLLKSRHLPTVDEFFKKATTKAETEPAQAVADACAMVESVFRSVIEESKLEMPAKQDIQGLAKVVQKALNLDPSDQPDADLRQILSGLATVVGAIGALRTHESTAHGKGKGGYRVEPRHARLAIHAASAVTAFVIEVWETRNKAPLSGTVFPFPIDFNL